MSAPLILLIHGAWAGTWVWDGTVSALRDAGFRAHAVELPGVGSVSGEATLESHIAAVTDLITESDATVYLIAHSGGGVIATAVAEAMPRSVAGIAYVAGIMLPSGLTFPQLCDEIALSSPDANGIMPYLIAENGATVVPAEAGVAVFFQRAATADAIAASRRLTPQPTDVLAPVVSWTDENFGSVPRLYLEAEFDRSIPLAMQRYMQERTPGAARVTLSSDHAPQLSAPDELVEALLAFVSS